MGQNRLGSQPCILQLISKPQELHLCQAAPTAAISFSEALPWSSLHYLTCLPPLFLSSYHPEGKVHFITSLSCSQPSRGSSITFKNSPDSLSRLSRTGAIWPLLHP